MMASKVVIGAPTFPPHYTSRPRVFKMRQAVEKGNVGGGGGLHSMHRTLLSVQTTYYKGRVGDFFLCLGSYNMN